MTAAEEDAKFYAAKSSRYYSRARSDAKRAGDWYRLAANQIKTAAWLTARPDLWEPAQTAPGGQTYLPFTPERFDGEADTFRRLGDTYLRASFHDTEMARHYATLTRSARARSAD
jgi:hypothetical protein